MLTNNEAVQIKKLDKTRLDVRYVWALAEVVGSGTWQRYRLIGTMVLVLDGQSLVGTFAIFGGYKLFFRYTGPEKMVQTIVP